MASNMDRSLDEILAERKPSRGRGPRGGNSGNSGSNTNNGGGGRRRDRDRRSARDEYPRDGVRKSYRDDYEPRKIDEEWVHDRYDDNANPHAKQGRRDLFGRADPEAAGGRAAAAGTRLRVENLHYDLTRDDLAGLFGGIGPVLSVKLLYDRAGRSEGVAYVTYADYDDAREAVREFDGANAKGQPIRLAIVSSARGGGGGGAVSKPGTGRPLAERVSRPGQQQQQQPGRRQRRRKNGGDGAADEDGDDAFDDADEAADGDDAFDDADEAADGDEGRLSVTAAARHGIDRYIPGEGGAGSRSRSRSPRPARQREGGRRPGERRRGGGGGGGDSGADRSTNKRPRKTQEELDAEMEDYFGGSGGGGGGGGDGAGEATEYHVGGTAPQQAAAAVDDDADMIG